MKTFVAVVSCLALAACGDDKLASSPDISTPDGIVSETSAETSNPDTSSSDAVQEVAAETSSDTTPSDADAREIEAPLTGLKNDPTYLVPGNVVRKTGVVAAGSIVAWVEHPDAEPPQLVVWDLATPAISPRAFQPTNLTRPRDLAVSDSHLVYVDDRYGDPDIFAVVLQTGVEIAVVTGQGAQEAPALLGTRVAWEDCSACVTGDGLPGNEPGREIIERDLATGVVRALTDDDVADRAPSYGMMIDGGAALTWVRGRATLHMAAVDGDVSATIDVAPSLRADQQLARTGLWDGVMVSRPSPLIVNPDSMIVNPDSMFPSDVLMTDPEAATTQPLTTHAEAVGGMDLGLDVAGDRLAWLESTPGDASASRIMIASGAGPQVQAEATRVSWLGMGRDFVVFTAPRDDNDGEEDVHVMPLDLP